MLPLPCNFPLADDQHLLAGKLLLQFSGELLVNSVELLEESERAENHHSSLPVANINLKNNQEI